MMIKLKAPANATSVSLEGHTIEVAADGSVTVDERDAHVLCTTHGFSRWGEPKVVDRRAELLGKISALSSDDLEALLALAEAGATLDTASVTVEQIDAMKRPDLFAFLRAKNVQAATPITNEKLRELARAALAPATPPAAAPPAAPAAVTAPAGAVDQTNAAAQGAAEDAAQASTAG